MTERQEAPSRRKRINEFLQAYWDDLRDSRPYPREDEIDMQDMADIWDSCFLIKCDPKTDSEKPFTYTYLGQALIEAYGVDSREKDICEKLVYPTSMTMVGKFREVMLTGRPVEEESEFRNHKNMLIKYRSTLLPLADETGRIGFILGGMKWKAY